MDPDRLLDILTAGFKDEDEKVREKKRLRVKRWLRFQISLVEDFDEVRLKFFSDVFADDACWNGTRLVNEALGKSLIAEKNKNEVDNPLDLSNRYHFACKYCLVDEIPRMFERVFNRYVKSVFEKSRSEEELKSTLLSFMKGSSPHESFWTSLLDENSKSLVSFEPLEGFKRAIEVNTRKNWTEGVEFFWEKLREDPDFEDKEELIIEAALSAVEGFKEVDTLEFCLRNMDDAQKKTLLDRDFERNTYYATMSVLSHEYHFDYFKEFIPLCEKTNHDWFLSYLSTLSDMVLKTPVLAPEVRDTMTIIWQYTLQGLGSKPILSLLVDYSVAHAIANLIIDQKESKALLEEILNNLKKDDMKDEDIAMVKEAVMHHISFNHGEKNFPLGEQVFSKFFEENSDDQNPDDKSQEDESRDGDDKSREADDKSQEADDESSDA